MSNKYFWLAINGPSCAANLLVATETPNSSPTPEYYIGFPTQVEAKHSQNYLLTASIPRVKKILAVWKQRDDVKFVVPNEPAAEFVPGMPTYWTMMPAGSQEGGAK